MMLNQWLIVISIDDYLIVTSSSERVRTVSLQSGGTGVDGGADDSLLILDDVSDWSVDYESHD